MLKKVLFCIVTFITLIIFLWGILTASACISNNAILANMEQSARFHQQVEPFAFDESGRYNAVTDNYSDSILLNVTWNMGNGNPLLSALDTKYYNGDNGGERQNLYNTVNGSVPNTDYTRYWHGSAAVIRPLMLITDSNGIKLIGLVFVLICAVGIITYLILKKHCFPAIAFGLSLLAIQIWNVGKSLEYIPSFSVCMIMCILFVLLEKRGNFTLTVLSVISGTAVAFFDFLTTETVTILMPLLLVFMIREENNSGNSLKENFFVILKCGITWLISYCMTFLVKWLLASMVTGENMFASAISSAEQRLSGATEELPLWKQIPSAVIANISTIFGGTERVDYKAIVIGLVITFTVVGMFFYIFNTKANKKSITVTALIIGLIPYVRYLVISNHSYLHEFFTYRAQCTAVLAILIIVWYNTDILQFFKKGKKPIQQKSHSK